MKIIKHGKKEYRLPEIRKFRCKKCECEFEAESNEWDVLFGWGEPNYYCRCPECGCMSDELLD